MNMCWMGPERNYYNLRRRTIYDDPFIRNYIEDLLENIRTQVGTSGIIIALPWSIAGLQQTAWPRALTSCTTDKMRFNDMHCRQ